MPCGDGSGDLSLKGKLFFMGLSVTVRMIAKLRRLKRIGVIEGASLLLRGLVVDVRV